MQQNQLIPQQPILTQALALLSTLTGSEHPTQLELYIQNLAQSEHDFEALVQAVEKQQLNENSTKLLCMLISKVLQSGHLEEMVELKAFMRLALNWSLPSSCKKMLEIDLRRFIKTISSEHLNYLFLLVERVQQLITSISQERIKKRYESSPFEMGGMQLTIYVNFPLEFVPMVQTYLLFMESVLYTNEGLHFMRTLTQNFHFLKTLHALIFEPKNIIDHPHLFGSLFQFWTELLQLYSNISQPKEFLGIVQHLGSMTAHISMIYEVLCPSDEEGIDYMQMEGHENAGQIMKLKAEVCEFHTTLLSQIQNCKVESVLLEDLSSLLPSLIKTAQKYLTTSSFEHAYEQDFIKNLLPLLSITVEVTAINNEDLVSLLVNLAIPFIQMGIQNTDQSEIVGEDLHAILDDCCELQSSGDLLSVAAQLLEKIFQKSDALLDYFYQIAHRSISNRFKSNHQESALNLQSRTLSLKAVFLGLSLSAYHEDQKYTTICSELAQLVSSQFLQLLSESELQFFFHFMNFSWIIFYEEDRSKLQMLIEYALSPRCFKRPSLQFFALQFLHCIFNELSTTEWLLKFITQMEMYKSAQSIGRKWAIFQHVVINNIIDFDTSKIVWVVECMHAGASRELERMENQKRQRYMVEYGQVNEYLSSLTNLQKKIGRNFMRRQIVHSLLDFASMVDRAALFQLEKELLKIAINVFPLCWKNAELIAKGLRVMQKILVIFVQRSYRGNGCLLAIFSGINAFRDEEGLSATLLRILQFGSRFVANNQSTLQDHLLQRTLLCLLCLLQKYLISFPILDQHKTTLSSIYHQLASVCQTALQHHTHNLDMLAAKSHLTTTIHRLLIDKNTDWQQLRTGSAEGWFEKYDAFILLHSFTVIVPEVEIETQRVVLQIGLLLLCYQQLHNKKYTKQDIFTKREPLEELHKTVDSAIYEKNLAEQVWMLFQCCGINSQQKCITMLPAFGRQAFDYLMFCRCIPNPRTQQEQLEYSKIKLAKIEQLQHSLNRLPRSADAINADSGIACERRIVRVTGDKLDSIYYSDQKTTFKRNIHKRFIEHSQITSGYYSDNSLTDSDSQEQQNSTPSKKLIDNYFMEHRAVRTMVNLSSGQKTRRREERYEKLGRMLLAADMKHLRTAQDE